ncbi:MAG: hypothetical protein J6W03_02580 [Bacteroidaceae bacterium]|nr:hypothetical protein [Bacteroidaceae bacterium]
MRAYNIRKKGIRWYLAVLALPILISSCSKDNEVVTTSNDYCYIKSVMLGTVKRKVGTISSSFTGSFYEMTVDLRNNTIENLDSLPYGSLLDRVIATITFDGSMLAYREKGSDNEWTAYNLTDSLDLTKPLELLLTSNDNRTSRIYTLKVNVHQQEGDSLCWNKCESEVTQLADMTDMKTVAFNDKLLVLGRKTAGIVLAERSSTEAESTWEETSVTDLPATTDLQTLHQQADMLYISTTDGAIFSSANAIDWRQEGTKSAELTLVEKTEDFFYAISEGKLLRSADASTWEEETLDTEASLLPQTGIRTLTLQQANGNTRIVMVGQREGSSNAVVWNKMWNDSEPEANAEWIYFPLSPDNKIPCPRLNHFNLLPYDGKCFAFGGASVDESHEALDVIYISQDYGITWRPTNEIHLPSELKGIEGCITSTVDENNFIWIITNAQVWRGRLNRLGFAQR